MKKTHYERLHVSEDTGPGELHDAWQRELQRIKLEVEPGIGQAVALAEVNESYRLLADRDRRAAYDRRLAEAQAEATSGTAASMAAPDAQDSLPAEDVDSRGAVELQAGSLPSERAEGQDSAWSVPSDLAEGADESVWPASRLADDEDDGDEDRVIGDAPSVPPQAQAAEPAPPPLALDAFGPRDVPAAPAPIELPQAVEAAAPAAGLPAWARAEAPTQSRRSWIALAAVVVIGAGVVLYGQMSNPREAVVTSAQAALPAAPTSPTASALVAAPAPATMASGVVTGLVTDPATSAASTTVQPVVVPTAEDSLAAATAPGAAPATASVAADAVAPVLPPNTDTRVSAAIIDSRPAAAAAMASGGAQPITLEEGVVVPPPPPRTPRDDSGAWRAVWLAAAWSNDTHLLDGDALALPAVWQREMSSLPVAR